MWLISKCTLSGTNIPKQFVTTIWRISKNFIMQHFKGSYLVFCKILTHSSHIKVNLTLLFGQVCDVRLEKSFWQRFVNERKWKKNLDFSTLLFLTKVSEWRHNEHNFFVNIKLKRFHSNFENIYSSASKAQCCSVKQKTVSIKYYL